MLEAYYNWAIRTDNSKLKIIEGKHTIDGITVYDQKTVVGETISVETEYMGIVTGTITQQIFNLNGGIIVKDTTLTM